MIDSIRKSGDAEAEQLVAAARQERERMLAELRAKGERLVEEGERRAREAGNRQRVQELARAELEAKKIVLLAQKEALEDVRHQTLNRLRDLPNNGELLAALLHRHAAEVEDGLVLCNEKDAPQVKKLVGKRFGSTIDCIGGAVIESEDRSYSLDLRYETVLGDIWESAVRRVAEALSGA